MTHRLLLIGMLTLGAFFFTSCDTDGQAGSFEVNFTWAKDTEGNELKPDLATGQFYLTVRLYEWQKGADFPGDIAVYGKQLKQTEAIQMQVDGTPFDLGAVSYGDDRVVVAEIRKGADLTTDPLYTGMSELFSIEKGKHKIVDVLMAMKPYTGVDDNGNKVEAELQIVDENGTVKAYTNGTALEVHLRLTKAVNFTKVYIANKEELLKGEDGIAVELADMLPVTGVENAYDLPDAWDISKGLSETEMARPELKVYARLENDYGEGVLLIAKIALDDVLPVLALELNYPNANSVTIKKVQLLVSAEELITTDGLSIISEGMVFDCPESIEPSLSFICTAIDDDSLMDGEYDIFVTALDRAGNRSAKATTTLTVDTTLPTLEQSTITPEKANAGATITIDFTASEELSELPQVQLGAVVLDCTQDTEEPKHYTCTHTVTGDEFDGVREVQVTLTDLAGNPNTLNPGSVDYDAAAPLVSGVTLLRSPAYPASADEENKTYYFSVKDPKTEEFVTATLYVYANEELGVAKSLTVSGPGELTFTEKGSTGSVAVFTYTLKDEDAAGEYTFSVTWEDTIGNGITTPLDTKMVIDKTVPSNTAIDMTKILYKRIPWGADATGGIPRFSVIGSAGAVTDLDATKDVYIYRSTSMSAGNLIGTAGYLGTDGSFTINELGGGDLPKIYVSFVNRSGLKSFPECVNEVEWIATMGNKTAGDTWKNPHIFSINAMMNSTLIQSAKHLRESTLDGQTKILQSGKHFDWEKWPTKLTAPDKRYDYAIAYDVARGIVLLFGGSLDSSGSNFYSSGTWRYQDNKWELLNPFSQPSPRSNSRMVYDNARGKILLFGGVTDRGENDETWEWDGSSWNQKNPSSKPSARDDHAMAYDSARGKAVLFGGYASGYNNETWEWDGTNWTQLNPATKPSARVGHAMVYDSARGKVVLFGGELEGWIDNNETWEWDGTNWTLMSPANKPTATGAQMVYDSARTKTLLFSYYENETWEWDGNDWVLRPEKFPPHSTAIIYDSSQEKVLLLGSGIAESGESEVWSWDGSIWTQLNPPQRNYFPSGGYSALTYDADREKVVLVGGEEKNEIWEWNGVSWNLLFSAYRFETRFSASIAYDRSRKKVLLFGGCHVEPFDISSLKCFDDTWEWDGTDWTQHNPATKPSTRHGHAMAYDSVRGKVVLFGGYNTDLGRNNETWEWDGTNWTQLNPSVKPSARYHHAMAYDSVRGKVVLFGGDNNELGNNNETWEWDGTNWTQLNPSVKPSARYNHSMAYDVVAGKVLLFGGYNDYEDVFYNEIWEWDGINWEQRDSAEKPSSDSCQQMAYDTSRSKLVLLAGADGSCSQTWEWGGAFWTQITLDPYPQSRNYPALAYDSNRDRVIMFGGDVGGDELWEWDGNHWLRKSMAYGPTERSQHAMAYDSARGEVLLFGGSPLNNETWSWDGEQWALFNPENQPSARWGHAMAYDGLSKKVIMFGGSTDAGFDNETWEWNGAEWKKLSPTINPPARLGHKMTYDSFREKIILSGGLCGGTFPNLQFCGDIWEWDGVTWHEATQNDYLVGDLTYDPVRGKTVSCYGYLGEYYDENSMLEWDGENWSKIEVLMMPSLRNGYHSVIYSEKKQSFFMFGGNDKYYNPNDNDLWLWGSAGNEYPGQIMNIAFENSGVTDDSTVTYQSLSVFFNAGGLGDITGTPTNGVDLLTWKHDQWVTVSSNTADPDNLAPVTWETTDPIEIQTLLNSGLRKFNFAVVPSAPNGFLTDMGKIATDYAEVVVRYTINE